MVGSMNAFEIFSTSKADVVSPYGIKAQAQTSFSIPIRRTIRTELRYPSRISSFLCSALR